MKVESSTISLHAEHESKQARTLHFDSLLEEDVTVTEVRRSRELECSLAAKFHFALISRLLEMLQGRGCSKDQVSQEAFARPQGVSSFPPEQKTVGTETLSVSEKLEVSMKGTVKTDRGSIDLDLFFSFSHAFVQSRNVTKEDFIDPLVINFSGEFQTLESTTFSFDIDCDGEIDQISKLREGNGFLALDRNANGLIDDGSELFGAKSGRGFAGLAEFDADNNGWIDENDSVWEKLRVWRSDGGEERLVALGEAGVGAIYLGQVHGPYTLRDNENRSLGRIRSSGLYLSEAGSAGALAQLDLKKHAPSPAAAPLAQALAAI